jgi:hypothetical protein
MGEDELLALCPGLFTPRERTRGAHCAGGWLGPSAGQNPGGREKFLPLSGIELRPSSPFGCFVWSSNERRSIKASLKTGYLKYIKYLCCVALQIKLYIFMHSILT